MRIHVVSDLHLEFLENEDQVAALTREIDLPGGSKAGDVLVIAGDLHVGSRGATILEKLARDRPVIYVLGNHEYYRQDFHQTRAAWQDAVLPGVHVLENTAAIVGGIRFLGSTLWADCAGEDPDVMLYVGAMVNDFTLIRRAGNAFSPEDMIAIHGESRAWLTAQLATPFPGPTVVITHHLPSERSIAPQFEGDQENGAFASDLDDLILQFQPALWIHGHTHVSCDYALGKTRVVCNPRGYPHEVNPRWNPSFTVEL